MKNVTVEIVGLSPMLQNAFGPSQPILNGGKGNAKTRIVGAADEETPRDAATRATYRTKDGRFYFPSSAIARLLRESAGNHKIRGTRRSAKYLIPSAVFQLADEVILTNGDGSTPITDFEVDSRPVTIPSTKGRIMRHRPRYDCWSARFMLEIDDELVSLAFVQQLVEEGGRRLGIGDLRPEKGGPFGRFRVTSFQES